MKLKIKTGNVLLKMLTHASRPGKACKILDTVDPLSQIIEVFYFIYLLSLFLNHYNM